MVMFDPFDTPSAPIAVIPDPAEVDASRVGPEPHRMPQCGRHGFPVEGCVRCETVIAAREVMRAEALERHRQRRQRQGRYGR